MIDGKLLAQMFLSGANNLYNNRQIVDELNVPDDKVLISCDRFGNTSSASIPLTIVSELSDKGAGIKRIFACGFGIGLSWGICVFDVDLETIKPVIQSDYYYNDKSIFGI